MTYTDLFQNVCLIVLFVMMVMMVRALAAMGRLLKQALDCLIEQQGKR